MVCCDRDFAGQRAPIVAAGSLGLRGDPQRHRDQSRETAWRTRIRASCTAAPPPAAPPPPAPTAPARAQPANRPLFSLSYLQGYTQWADGRATFYGTGGFHRQSAIPSANCTRARAQLPEHTSGARAHAHSHTPTRPRLLPHPRADAWNIHHGSCGYGYLDRGVGTGWDIAAISDVAKDFKGSCG